MRIGLDCRLYGLKHAGIGRYVENLVTNILALDKENEYVLFVNQGSETEIKIQNSKVKIVVVNIPHYSLKEQLLFPFILTREKLDLVHFPAFNLPVFYRGRFVVTVHDLIKHAFRGKDTTTRWSGIYWLKYWGYRAVFAMSVKRAQAILVPSFFVKEELTKNYRLNPKKIIVTYEGVDLKLNSAVKIPANRKGNPYLLYVGSVYPHKNIVRLIEAVKLVNRDWLLALKKNKSHTSDRLPVTLAIVCARNVFWERLREKIKELQAEKLVNLLGFVSDNELVGLYQNAVAFVFPSLMEGFGLPGLEAMSQRVPVIASNIPVFKEIYKEAAVYFNPQNPRDMADKIELVIRDKKIRERKIKEGQELVKKYSWLKMAKETLRVYKLCLKTIKNPQNEN